MSMVIATALLTIEIPHATSLEDKRTVIRPLLARVRAWRPVSIAEVGMHERVRGAQLGFAVVADDDDAARAQVEELRRFIIDDLDGVASVIDERLDARVLEERYVIADRPEEDGAS
ncbi:MAG: DUF503 family protein [Dehalococcoidia bacterium]